MSQLKAPSRQDLERAASIYFRELAAELDQPRHFDIERFDEELATNVEASRARIRELDDQLRGNVFDARTELAVGEMLRGLDCDSSVVGCEDQLAARQLAARALREQMQLLVHMLTTPAASFVPSAMIFASKGDRGLAEAPPENVAENTGMSLRMPSAST